MTTQLDALPEGWHPKKFGFEVLGCTHTLKFPTAKLLDYQHQEASLQENNNPFALVTLAHLLTQETRKDMNARFAAKWKLVQLLYKRGWEKQQIIDLFLVLDWMMRLPEHLTQALWQNIEVLEEKEKMRYVSTVEKIGLEKGMQQGMQQGEASALQKILIKRFGPISDQVTAKIAAAETAQLEAWLDQVLDAPNVESMFGSSTH